MKYILIQSKFKTYHFASVNIFIDTGAMLFRFPGHVVTTALQQITIFSIQDICKKYCSHYSIILLEQYHRFQVKELIYLAYLKGSLRHTI